MPVKNGGFTLTRSGLQFLLVILAMMVAAINYANTMAYLLAFFCISLLLVSLVQAGIALTGVAVKSIQPQSAFAGGQIRIVFEMENASAAARQGLMVSIRDQDGILRLSKPFSPAPGSVTMVDVFLPVRRRGIYVVRDMAIETFFPFGLFRFRKNTGLKKEYLVFPRPAGQEPWPVPRTVWFENTEGFHFSGGDDFTGLRPHRPGEPQHHIDWKAYARGRPLSIKEFSSGGSLQYWFDWSILPFRDGEERLSQLTRWVLEADHQGIEFGLRLPGTEIGPDSSSRHTHKCLVALALFRDRS